MKRFNIIVACDNNFGIGNNGSLPWAFKQDMLYFRNITSTNQILPLINKSPNIIIMGMKTFESIGFKSLPNRVSFVITSKKIENSDTVKYFSNFYEALNYSSNYLNSDVWVIGGSSIYNMAIRHWACHKIYLTQIDNIFNCDTFLDFNMNNIKWTNELPINDLNILDNKTYKLTFKEGIVNHNVETQYLETLYNVLINGEKRMTRNGYTYSKFNKTISWDLKDGFPLLTTKKMFWKGIVEELLFFIRGDTDSNKLSEKGIKIWEPNTRRYFLDNLGLDYPEGEMGPMYGYQWRYFNKPYPVTNDYNNGIDQLQNIINEIKNNPTSRRLIMTDFNPVQVSQGVLYPCHSIVIQFYVEDNKLNCSMYQRSGDLFLGIPFNIASTSLLLCIIAQLTNLEPSKVNLIIGDYHIYEKHYNQVLEQLKRTSYNLPKINIKKFNSLKEVEESSLDDYQLIDYASHPTIKADMIS